MPLYDFRCAACGPFEVRRTIAELDADVACPDCGADAARVFRSPALGGRRSAAATADAIDDRSRNAPERVRGLPGHAGSHGHDHGPTRPWQIAH